MPEFTIPQHGAFCWYELSTKDADAAKKFYGELLGWQFSQSGVTDVPYTEIVVGNQAVGGVYQQTAEECAGAPADMPSHWMAYVAVEDVDAAAARVEGLGGKVCVPPTDIPNVGRFSVINDPTGATLSIIKFSGAHD